MPLSDAKRKANNKWDAANMEKLGVKVKKTYGAAVRAKAAHEGTTVNAILKAALDDFLSDEKPN